MADEELEHRVIDTRVQPPKAELSVDPDLEINIIPTEDGKYDVIYTRKVPADINFRTRLEYVPIYFFALTRVEMVQEHVRHIQAVKPKTVLITSGEDQRTLLHPGVVKSIIEGKLEVARLVLR